ncbi:MAG: hypothetical protein ACR2JE_17210 [Acidobacteriaceae bacterium]
MRTKVTARSYDEILQLLRGAQFDVREAPAVAGHSTPGQISVTKYGVGAVLARSPGAGAPNQQSKHDKQDPEERHAIRWVQHPGWVLGGQVSTLLDRGYQKFFTTPKLTVAATADGLKAIHRFAEELREIIGEASLYNESLGSVSDSYMYDRVKGRDLPVSERPIPAWDLPGKR